MNRSVIGKGKKRKLKKNIVNKEKTLLENFDYKYVTALEQGIYV